MIHFYYIDGKNGKRCVTGKKKFIRELFLPKNLSTNEHELHEMVAGKNLT
jgi:hypothetical protein